MRRGWVSCCAGLILLSGCASGNWTHFRPERFEAAQSQDDAVIRAETYDTLSKVQALSAKGQHVDALDRLQDLEAKVQGVPKEEALFHQARAYVLMTMGRSQDALEDIERALELGTLPEQTQQDLRYNQAQIYVQAQDYKRAAPVLEQWISQSENPEAQAVALLAYIYHEAQSFALAARYAKMALALEPKNTEWMQMLLSCQFELKQYKKARRTLLVLLGQAPTEPAHWRMLSQLDLLLALPLEAQMSLELVRGTSTLSPHEVLQLARMSLLHGLPDRAVTLLTDAMARDDLTKRAEHWSLLGHAHLAAKDTSAAMEAFEESRKRLKDPQANAALCLRMAGLGMSLGAWAKVQRYAHCAQSSEDLQVRANAQLMDGIASYQLRNFERSLSSLKAAQGQEATRANAKQWSALVRTQMTNLAQLEQGPQSNGHQGASVR